MLFQHLNFDQNYKTSRNMTYYGKTIRMDKNPIKTVFNVCDKLIDKRVSLSTVIFILVFRIFIYLLYTICPYIVTPPAIY